MTIETASYISQLNATYPEDAADRLTADDHLRLIKAVVKASFPAITGVVTVTPAELNLMLGNSKTVESTMSRLSETVYNTFLHMAAVAGAVDAVVADTAVATSATRYQATMSVCLSATSLHLLMSGLPPTMKRVHIHIRNLTTSHPLGAYQRFQVIPGTASDSPDFPGLCAVLTAAGPEDPGFSFSEGALVSYGIAETETAVFTGSIQMMLRADTYWALTVDGYSQGNAATVAKAIGHFINETPVTVERISLQTPDTGVTFLTGEVHMWIEV